jgi:NTP pyrophosphatase (non-canonical NTP hydrolase)
MNMKLQKRVAAFVEVNGLETDVAHRVLDLTSEIGEVAKEVLKSTRYGKTRFNRSENWESELGDILFSVICVANTTHVDLEKALVKVLTKYGKRILNTKDAGSGK